MTFYTYIWLREDGTPYYVGKGVRRRGFQSSGHSVGAPSDERFILIQDYPDASSALAAENFLIEFYGRLDLGTGGLENKTDGGPPSHLGIKRSAETRAKLSASCMGRAPNSRSFKPGHAVPREWIDKARPKLQHRKSNSGSFVKGMTPWNKGVKRGH